VQFSFHEWTSQQYFKDFPNFLKVDGNEKLGGAG
jgi:hypothetical protein